MFSRYKDSSFFSKSILVSCKNLGKFNTSNSFWDRFSFLYKMIRVQL